MSNEEKIEESREDGKTESPEESSTVHRQSSTEDALTESEIKTMEVHHHPNVEKLGWIKILITVNNKLSCSSNIRSASINIDVGLFYYYK